MIRKYLKLCLNKLVGIYSNCVYFLSRGRSKRLAGDFRLSEIPEKFPSLNSQYMHFHQKFWNTMPIWLKHHREYFKLEQRGFGEDAFHAMWHDILKEYRPRHLLEIGVYRGQVISLWSLLAKHLDIVCDIHAISPFTSAGDDVSVYISNLDYYDDVHQNFSHFQLCMPHLHKGFSTDPEMIDVISSRQWDLIYIDGSHDYEVVKSDFQNCSKMLSKNGLIVLDDSAVGTAYEAPIYSSNGHPDPSRVAAEIDPAGFKEILSVGHNRVFKKI